MKTIKRFLKAKGSLRFKILYALDYWRDIETDRFFVCENLEAGKFASLTRHGYIHKSIK